MTCVLISHMGLYDGFVIKQGKVVLIDDIVNSEGVATSYIQ